MGTTARCIDAPAGSEAMVVDMDNVMGDLSAMEDDAQ